MTNQQRLESEADGALVQFRFLNSSNNKPGQKNQSFHKSYTIPKSALPKGTTSISCFSFIVMPVQTDRISMTKWILQWNVPLDSERRIQKENTYISSESIQMVNSVNARMHTNEGTLRPGLQSFSSHPTGSFGLVRHSVDQTADGSNQYATGTLTSRTNSSMPNRFPAHTGNRQSPVGNNIVPRVTFKENVDTIANVSPNASDPGSQNTSSNDSGIDNFKPTEPNISNTLNGQNTDSSGTYDNAFTPTVRPTLVIRSSSQTAGNRNELSNEIAAPSGTLLRVLPPPSTFPTTTGQAVMNASIYSNRLPTFGAYGQPSSEQTALLDSTDSDLAGLLKPPDLSLTSTTTATTTAARLTGQNEMMMTMMIGDGASSLQSSSTAAEPYPLLLSSCLLSDETHEPRLCSQV